METIKIAKAIIKYNQQYLVKQSNSLLKKWQFFDVIVDDGQNEIGALSKELKNQLDISTNPGKVFCEISYFENGKKYDVKAFVVNIFNEKDFEKYEPECKLFLLSEMKTLKWENIDKVIMQKLLDENK